MAQLSSDSLVGDKFVDITSGTSPKGIAPHGEMIYKDQPELLRSLDLVQFTQQLRAIDSMLADIEAGRSQFGKFYKGDQFYNDLEKRLKDIQAAFEDSVSTTSLVSGLINSDVMHRQVADMIANLDQAMAKLQAGQGPAGQLLRNTAQYDQLMTTVHGFRTSLQTIGGNPLLQSDTAYDNTGQWLAALIRSVDELNRNPQLNSTFFYENLNGQLKELRDGIKDFRSNPRKYLRLKVF